MPFFTPPLQVDNYLYDAGAVGKHTKSVYEFDNYGNMTREESHGEANDPPADRTVVRDYYYNLTNHIVGLPYRETVYEGIGTTVPKSSIDYYYDDLTSCTATPTNNQTPYNGNLTRVKRWLDGGDSPEQWTAYDSYGNVACTRDPNNVLDPYGKITTITYDSTYTFPKTVTNPLQHSVTSKYYGVDGEPADKGLYGQVKSSTDANEAVTSHEYDNLGRKTLETLPDGFATSWDYSGFPQYIKTTDSAQIWTDIYLDGLGRPWREERKGPENKTIVTDTLFDARGAIRQKSLPYFKTLETPRYVTFSYDPLGRTTDVLNPGSTTATRSCYSAGVQVSVDANNHRKRQTKDAFGRLVKVEEYQDTFSDCSTEPGTPYASTTYKYDVLGNLALVTDTLGNTFEMRYDSLGRKYYMKDPDMGEWNYDYDANGNLNLQIDAKEQNIKFSYDALNRLRIKDFGADNVIDVTFTYDEATSTNPICRLTTMTDGSGSTKYDYDNSGRILRTTKTVDGIVYPTTFGYDTGRLASITYPDNETLTYHYDPAGNLDQAIGYATYAGFNALGQPGSITYGNNVVTNFSYIPTNNRLQNITTTSPTQGGLVNLTYEYYNNGNIWKITDNLNAVIPHNFVSESFTPHFGKPHAIGSIGSGRSFQYDGNGNMTSDGKRSVTYNIENMPTSVNGDLNFTYDGNGQRVKKSSAAGSRIYIDNLYECGDGSCGKYIFAGETRVALKRGTGELLYYHQDHLGSTVVATDGNGAVAGALGNTAETIAYYPFGETRADSGVENLNHKYTSQEIDYETGLYNYNARLYSPEIGRFISADSIISDPTNPQNLNRYSYVLNNPTNLVDPTGNEASSDLYINGNSNNGNSSENGGGGGSGSFKEDWKPWAQRFERIGREFGRWGKDIGKFFSGLFGHKKSSPQPTPFDINGDNSYVAQSIYAISAINNMGQSIVTSEPFIRFGEMIYTSQLNSALTGSDFRGNEFSGFERVEQGLIALMNAPASPALKGSPYHPESVATRIHPSYRANPAHDPHSPSFNMRKTPEPTDAASVYKNALRTDMGTWYGRGNGGWYRYSSDNAGGVHFSGSVPERHVPIDIRRKLGGL